MDKGIYRGSMLPKNLLVTFCFLSKYFWTMKLFVFFFFLFLFGSSNHQKIYQTILCISQQPCILLMKVCIQNEQEELALSSNIGTISCQRYKAEKHCNDFFKTLCSFHRRCFSTKGHLPPKVAFHQRSSFTEGCLPPKVIFHQKSSSTKVCLPLKVIFH